MPLAPGDAAPELDLPAAGGGRRTLADLLEGGPVAIAVFKEGCPTCRLAFPALGDVERRFPGRVVAVTQDSAESSAGWLAEHGFDGELFDDTAQGYAASNALAVTNVPTVTLVGEGGEVVQAFHGWSRDEVNRLVTGLAERLGGDASPVSTPADGRPDLKPG